MALYIAEKLLPLNNRSYFKEHIPCARLLNSSLIFVLLAFFCAPGYSQQLKSVTISGTVVEDFEGKALSPASITLLTSKDSLLVKACSTDSKGLFSMSGISPASYLIKITFLGYSTLRKEITVKDQNAFQNLGSFRMAPGSSMMHEVVITGVAEPVQVKNDTIEFNSDVFKTEKNAVIEDMLKKMPGLEIDGEGKIKAQGTEVSRVFVDGKPFFGNDPAIALQNLPADMVAKVQVIDKKSDQAEFSKIDDGQVEKVINIVTRQGYKNGKFGKVSAGYGTNERYDAGAMFNQFKDDQQFSVLGMSNNINMQKFTVDIASMNNARKSTLANARNSRTGQGGRGMGGGGGNRGGFSSMTSTGRGMMGNGITVTHGAGINYHDILSPKLEVTGSYFLNESNNDNNTISLTQTLIGDSSIFRHDTSINISQTINHRVTMELNYKADSMNSFIFRPNISYSLSNSDRSTARNTIGESGFPLNASNSNSQTDGNGWNNSGSLLYRRGFKKPRRSLTINVSGNLRSNYSEIYKTSYIEKFKTSGVIPSVVKTNLFTQNNTSGDGYAITFAYTEPLSKATSLNINYNYSYTRNLSDKSAFDYNEAIKKYDIPDSVYSNKYTNNFINQRAGITLQTQKNKIIGSIGLGIESSNIASLTHIADTLYDRSHKTLNFSPTASLNYIFTKRKRLSLRYRGITNEPGIDQLQPIVTDPNSLTIRKGNLDLKASFTHDVSLDYNTVNPKTLGNFYLNMQYSAILYSIVNNYDNGRSGEQVIIPVNVNGEYDASLNMGIGQPLAKNKLFLNTSTSINWNNDISYVKNSPKTLTNYTPLDTSGSKRNLTRALSIGYNLSWRLTTKVIMFTALGRINYNRAWQTIQSNAPDKYVNYSILGDLKLLLPLNFSLSTEYQLNMNRGYSSGYNYTYALWNAAVMKDIFKRKKAQVKLQVLDILKQNQSISRSIRANNIVDTRSTILPQYIMLSFTYNFSNFKAPEGLKQGGMKRNRQFGTNRRSGL